MVCKKPIRSVIILCLVFLPAFSFAQDTLSYVTRHQLGIDASKFLALFNEQSNNVQLAYRYHLNRSIALRAGLGFEYINADDGLLNVLAKVGVDRKFKTSEKWSFYYGVEGLYSKTEFNSSDRQTVRVGAVAFIGILFHLSPHFSLATEPNISAINVHFTDADAFDPTRADRSYWEYEIGNIGQLQLNFHF